MKYSSDLESVFKSLSVCYIWQLREILEAEGMCRQMFAENGLEEVKKRMADALQNYQSNGSGVSTRAPHTGCLSDISNLVLNLTYFDIGKPCLGSLTLSIIGRMPLQIS